MHARHTFKDNMCPVMLKCNNSQNQNLVLTVQNVKAWSWRPIALGTI